MESISEVLHQHNIDLNFKNCDGNTLLLMSLEEKDSNIAMSLLQAGCDVNITNEFKCTPLHKAITSDISLDITHELIKRGADINAQRENGDTPLHDAIYCGNLEIVCMLLYYGADVNISCNQNMTPIMWAFVENELEICEALFKCYDDFSCKDESGNTALHLAIMHKNSLAIDLVEAGADVNCITVDGDFPLLHTLKYENVELFKLIWSGLDYQILLEMETPFLSVYLNNCCYSTSGWVECLYLILKSSIASGLVEHCRNYREYENDCFNLLSNVLYNFVEKLVELKDRITIIYILLSLGTEVTTADIYVTHQVYGFKVELEAFVYAGSGNYCNCIKPLPSFILALEDDFNIERIFGLFINQVMAADDVLVIGKELNETLYSFGFFSLPHNLKQNLLQMSQIRWSNHHHMLKLLEEKLNTMPEVPSLLELCRNQVYKLIKLTCIIKTAYQFHDIVSILNLPQQIKDVVRFKKPIY